ncbi:MAG: P pilus assembly/Cpx signaling pathway, periplasmic inhibitor/zinc-resistance associated protein [Scytonema sp. RU_4_4]|nr:P pilus assembly/Cpx signaling pathway, periplasmic inhibitor/zinc-resistance associated protein [Scytonema sp. RU_4_4]NJR75161.1 P pilus assembly/Cpx signaling pathway, periplasmic inhibitor/zinc-resistance associated protein [Scytonema sp. CRU_2_7]
MQLKNLSLICGILALSLTVTSFAVKAEANSSLPLVIAQSQEKGGVFQRLGLTDEQKTKIQEIRRSTRTELDKILTEQQREQLKTTMQNRQGGRRVFDSLNLSDEQKNQLRQVMQSQKTQIEALLTTEQKEQLQKHREQMRARRQQRNM